MKLVPSWHSHHAWLWGHRRIETAHVQALYSGSVPEGRRSVKAGTLWSPAISRDTKALALGKKVLGGMTEQRHEPRLRGVQWEWELCKIPQTSWRYSHSAVLAVGSLHPDCYCSFLYPLLDVNRSFTRDCDKPPAWPLDWEQEADLGGWTPPSLPSVPTLPTLFPAQAAQAARGTRHFSALLLATRQSGETSRMSWLRILFSLESILQLLTPYHEESIFKSHTQIRGLYPKIFTSIRVPKDTDFWLNKN